MGKYKRQTSEKESSSLTELVTEQPDQKRNNGIKSKETTSTTRNTRKY